MLASLIFLSLHFIMVKSPKHPLDLDCPSITYSLQMLACYLSRCSGVHGDSWCTGQVAQGQPAERHSLRRQFPISVALASRWETLRQQEKQQIHKVNCLDIRVTIL